MQLTPLALAVNASLESFDELEALNSDDLEGVGEEEFDDLSNDVDLFTDSLESLIETGECSPGTARMVYASLESIANRIGYNLQLPSLEDATSVDVGQVHEIAMEAFGDIIGRFIQGYIGRYKLIFAALIILFQGRAKLAARHKERIGEYRKEWKEKESSLYRISQDGNAWGDSTALVFWRNNRVETNPCGALKDDLGFYRWLFGPYSRSLEQAARQVGSIFSSTRITSSEDVDKLVEKIIKCKPVSDLFDHKYLNKGPVLLTNLGFKLKSGRAPRPAGRTEQYQTLAVLSASNRVAVDSFPLRQLVDLSVVWKDLKVKNSDVLSYLDDLEDSCDLIIEYVNHMKVHTQPYWDMVEDMKKATANMDALSTKEKKAIKQAVKYGDSIRYQHFFLVKQMSQVLVNVNTGGTHFISRLIARAS